MCSATPAPSEKLEKNGKDGEKEEGEKEEGKAPSEPEKDGEKETEGGKAVEGNRSADPEVVRD